MLPLGFVPAFLFQFYRFASCSSCDCFVRSSPAQEEKAAASGDDFSAGTSEHLPDICIKNSSSHGQCPSWLVWIPTLDLWQKQWERGDRNQRAGWASARLMKSEESPNLKCHSLTHLKAWKLNSRTSHRISGTESWPLGQHMNQTQHKFSSMTSLGCDFCWLDPHSAAMLNNLNNHSHLSAGTAIPKILKPQDTPWNRGIAYKHVFKTRNERKRNPICICHCSSCILQESKLE